MQSISTPLSVDELIALDQFLIQRLGDDDSVDYGVLCISELDGFFTAVTCSPNRLLPSQWLPALWAKSTANFRDEQHYSDIMQLLGRYHAGVDATLKQTPDAFNPIFHPLQTDAGERESADPWCVGFMRAFDISGQTWFESVGDIGNQLVPILTFGTPRGQESLAEMSPDEITQMQSKIAASAAALYRYWTEKRDAESGP